MFKKGSSVSSQVKVGVSELIGKGNIADWCTEISNAGIDVEVIEFPNQPVAALEWLLPTGIVLYLAKPYFETILKEAAKEHYQILKKVVLEKIYPRHIGESGQKLVTVTAGGKEKGSSFFSRTFSISTSLQKGEVNIELKLLIPENASLNDVDMAFSEFGKLIINEDEESLISTLVDNDSGRLWSKVLWLNPETQTIELIDVVQSSKLKIVVSCDIQKKT